MIDTPTVPLAQVESFVTLNVAWSTSRSTHITLNAECAASVESMPAIENTSEFGNAASKVRSKVTESVLYPATSDGV